MTADKMFKKLGYKKQETEDTICYMKFNNEDRIAYAVYISFYKELKNFAKFYRKSKLFKDEIADISMNELKAINQQCLELGWLE